MGNEKGWKEGVSKFNDKRLEGIYCLCGLIIYEENTAKRTDKKTKNQEGMILDRRHVKQV